MLFDYDVVVIGSTPEGIYAAQKAVLLQARTALVTQTEKEYTDYNSFIYNRCLSEITNSVSKFEYNPWGIWQEAITTPKVSLQDIKSYGDLVTENITAEHSLGNLAALGVDVIYGKGEFCRLPKQAFLVGNRQLRSRNYLLATGTKYQIENKYQAAQLNCLTPDDLWQKDLNNFPKSLVIVGDSHRSLELAQGLARLGKQVTLTTSNKILLPGEAVAASQLLQAQFAADGITVLLNSSIEQIQAIENKIWLQIGDLALETEVVVFTHKTHLNITGLNLEGVGVTAFFNHISVNEKLQTRNKSIYACGDLLGGDFLPHIAQYQVDIALKNMLSFPWFKTDYRYLPTIILTQPNIARIGLTNLSSQQKKPAIYLVKQHFKSITQAQITGVTTGWCQFIIKANGEILGCTIVGDRSTEIINIVTLMIRHKIKLTRNPIQGLLRQDIPYVTPSYSEIFNQVAIAFHQQKIQRDRKLKNRLATWFDWRK
ncbi:Pyruvate/2-oxoglutarate dehydrogenase complex, dihydrolipoamide dehydrogenase component [Hyella patelloides LEGE 07179]|uniref:Pyruvate/2-oxoglutarate dehydrogenase complex, dihydrolipoamide dehydrogenase component n=1 Tax=Hyella patelloides LEGE 07179 TaxID=945734 RepID=A0A563VWZ2_9CYAN|nr:FAD-dependent oxidoreductase [Hyella patelloides]VEP15907.1 Pyruvate/2-oxoglutarate dehydrogenase complex, dihydrolipoamide dehydrogenase component [Hyella patelloides LEGE 07179]